MVYKIKNLFLMAMASHSFLLRSLLIIALSLDLRCFEGLFVYNRGLFHFSSNNRGLFHLSSNNWSLFHLMLNFSPCMHRLYYFFKRMLCVLIAMVYMARTLALTNTIFVVSFFNNIFFYDHNRFFLNDSFNILRIFDINNFFLNYNFFLGVS